MSDTETKARQAADAPVKGGVTPYLNIDGAVRAVEFYKSAFAAEVAALVPPDDSGRTMHAHLYINDGSLMLSDFYPEHGHPAVQPQGFSLTLQVDDIDRWWERATKAGATVAMPLQQMFWGTRYGQLKDPFGVVWALNERRPQG